MKRFIEVKIIALILININCLWIEFVIQHVDLSVFKPDLLKNDP